MIMNELCEFFYSYLNISYMISKKYTLYSDRHITVIRAHYTLNEKIEKLNSHLNFGRNFFLIHFVDETQFPNSNPLPFHLSSVYLHISLCGQRYFGLLWQLFSNPNHKKRNKNYFFFYFSFTQMSKISIQKLTMRIYEKKFVFGNLEIDSFLRPYYIRS